MQRFSSIPNTHLDIAPYSITNTHLRYLRSCPPSTPRLGNIRYLTMYHETSNFESTASHLHAHQHSRSTEFSISIFSLMTTRDDDGATHNQFSASSPVKPPTSILISRDHPITSHHTYISVLPTSQSSYLILIGPFQAHYRFSLPQHFHSTVQYTA